MLNALVSIWLELAPWLLLGTFIASLLHVVLPAGWVQRHLGGRFSVLKAVAIGVPLPLCSCGVIPAGIGLRRDGATRGASVAFITATPQTGVDSILVAASFLGWPFALFKVAAALVTGLAAGFLTDAVQPADAPVETHHDHRASHPATLSGRLLAMRDHALELLRTIWGWIVIGVVASAAITAFLPPDLFAQSSAWGDLVAMLIALVVSLPLYVCATASVPIAAALVGAGMPVGAALVFLMAGPATNVATIGAVYRAFGLRSTAVYLATLIVGSVGFGLLFDTILPSAATLLTLGGGHDHSSHPWWAIASGVVLAALLLLFAAQDGWTRLQRLRQRFATPPADLPPPTLTLPVQGMSCGGCAGKLERAVRALPSVQSVTITLEPGQLTVTGAVTPEQLAAAVREVGFTPGDACAV